MNASTFLNPNLASTVTVETTLNYTSYTSNITTGTDMPELALQFSNVMSVGCFCGGNVP